MLTLALLIALFTLTSFTFKSATSGTPARDDLIRYRLAWTDLAKKKCLARPVFRVKAWYVPVSRRVELARRAKAGWIAAMYAGSHCPRTPEQIIRAVFPDATEDAALRVAYCESRLYPRAKNPRSSASGLFQLIGLHWEGKFDPFDPWANTRYAARLSSQHDSHDRPIPGTAGTNWGAWVCKP